MQPLSWYYNRLSLMSAGEIAWRASRALSRRLERIGPAPAEVPAPRGCEVSLAAWPAPAGPAAGACVEAAESIVAGRLEVFGRPLEVGFPDVEWNRDPLSGVRAPLTPGTSIDYRDARVAGNARAVWEVNRHFQLVTLAQAWAVSGERRWHDAALALLQSWLRACPYPLGLNWASALESAIRLINWYAAWRMLQPSQARVRAGWLDSIYQHCRFISAHRSRYSSANNHLIGEMAGLYVACCAWPLWPQSRKWRAAARAALEREARLQVHEDGVSREQSVGYQFFVLQFLIVAGLVGEAHGEPFPAGYWVIVQRMIGFLRSIADRNANLPDFGDSDDGAVLRLAPGTQARRLTALLDLQEAWSSRAPRPCGTPAAAWLSSGFAQPRAWPGTALARAMAFAHGGYYVLGGGFGGPQEVLLVFDAAPLGYLSIAAHGHADALSFTLSIGGQPLLIDPGTYCYHDAPRWRSYFRGTSAHNTVGIDDRDQSQQGGSFMWLSKARTVLETCQLHGPLQVVAARHDGYGRLRDPVTHRREIRLDLRAQVLEVLDTISCAAEHEVRRFWHFGPDWTVERGADALRISTPAAPRTQVTLKCADGALALVRAGVRPLGGWVSPQFARLCATTTAVATRALRGSATLRTVVRWETADPASGQG